MGWEQKDNENAGSAFSMLTTPGRHENETMEKSARRTKFQKAQRMRTLGPPPWGGEAGELKWGRGGGGGGGNVWLPEYQKDQKRGTLVVKRRVAQRMGFILDPENILAPLVVYRLSSQGGTLYGRGRFKKGESEKCK